MIIGFFQIEVLRLSLEFLILQEEWSFAEAFVSVFGPLCQPQILTESKKVISFKFYFL